MRFSVWNASSEVLTLTVLQTECASQTVVISAQSWVVNENEPRLATYRLGDLLSRSRSTLVNKILLDALTEAAMTAANREGITVWLEAAAEGETEAKEQLFEVTYHDLKEIADSLMMRQISGHTLQPTALVNEAAMRLMGHNSLAKLKDSKHFFAAVAQTMRCVLVDHARKRKSKRRGGDFARVDLDSVLRDLAGVHGIDVLELDEALDKLELYNPGHAELVHFRFFLGMSVEEIAKQQGVSKSTVERRWRFVRAWLAEELQLS